MNLVLNQNKSSWDAMADTWFGSTALPVYGCLAPTEDELHLFPDLSGKKVLDIGCGSGILSLCALLLGAKSATGVDIDALAVKTAVENGRENGFSAPRFTVLQGDLTEQVKGRFDIVVANIVADVIIRFCKDVRQFMKPGAVFITSGIIDTREEDILAAFAQYGFTIQERHEDGGWVCFVCTA